jgi:hypothetical protein
VPFLSFTHILIIQWPHKPPQPARQRSMPSSKRLPPPAQRSSAVSLSTPDSPWLVPSAVQLPTEASHLSMCKFAIPILLRSPEMPVFNFGLAQEIAALTDITSSQRQDKNTTRSPNIQQGSRWRLPTGHCQGGCWCSFDRCWPNLRWLFPPGRVQVRRL